MIDRGLESDFVPYKLTMRILFFLMSSVAQLEVELYIGRGVFLKKYIKPDFKENL